MISCNYLIVGAGINGLTFAYNLLIANSAVKIIVIDKELGPAFHASGRSSGNLHAGFFFSDDHFKIKLSFLGNQLTKQFIQQHNVQINHKPALITAKSIKDIAFLETLHNRAKENDIPTDMISSSVLSKIEPQVHTYKYALLSHANATTNASMLCKTLYQQLEKNGVTFFFNHSLTEVISDNQVLTSQGTKFSFSKLINCAGLYVDKIAQKFNHSTEYTIVPVKGIYYKSNNEAYKLNVSLYNPPYDKGMMLGTHLVMDYEDAVTIGAVTSPAFWRENYCGWSRFNFAEFIEILGIHKHLLSHNKEIRKFVFNEYQKYSRRWLLKAIRPLIKSRLQVAAFNQKHSGIVPKLYHKERREIINSLTVANDNNTFHLLNGIIHGLTSSFALTQYLINEYNL